MSVFILLDQANNENGRSDYSLIKGFKRFIPDKTELQSKYEEYCNRKGFTYKLDSYYSREGLTNMSMVCSVTNLIRSYETLSKTHVHVLTEHVHELTEQKKIFESIISNLTED